MKKFLGRLALQQRVLPSYRIPFFDLLASQCTDGLSLFAGQPRPKEAIHTSNQLEIAQYYRAANRHYFGGPIYICNQSNIIQWLQDNDPQALIVEANPRYPSTRAAIRWIHSRNRPVVGWGLGAPPIMGMFAPFRRRSRLKLLRSLDAIVAYSSPGAEQYRQLGLPTQRIFVAPNASAHRPDYTLYAREEGFNQRPCILFVGRLQARKRIDLLLQACANLPDDIAPRLILVGDGPARTDLESQAAQVYPDAEFVGERHGLELVEFYQHADLFVLPGTGGLAIQEAMSHALPVIVASGDGTQADLVSKENGWLVTPNDLNSLTNSITDSLSDVYRLRRMGAESYRIALEEVNIETMVSVFLNVLRQVTRKE